MKTSSDPKSVRQYLNRFAVATVLVGVGLLALAVPAAAEIVYTPTDITIGPNASYNLDVNHDGVTDFTISTKFSTFRCPEAKTRSLHLHVFETPASGNGAEGKGNLPARLIDGDQIGPSKMFRQVKGTMAYYDVSCPYVGWPIFPPPPPTVSSGGNWLNSFGYLGLSFQFDGQTYYGWASLTVGEDTAALTGYAYETIPGMPITAGQTTDADSSSALSPGPAYPEYSGLFASVTNPTQAVSLGTLVLGAQEFPLWRRKESVGTALENV